jgi:GT2 family glycosyltransferase
VSDPRVSTVLVNWNNFRDSAECLESLGQCTYPNHEVTVVDNGSDGNEAELLRRSYGDRIRLIENERNLGFAGGCNVGIRDALQRGSDYVLLLNNDTVVAPEFLSELIGAVQARSGVGVAGGKILCHELPGVIWSAGGTIDYRYGKTPMRGSGEVDDGRFDEEAEVDWVCSCFMLVPRAVWDSVGLLDERFFFGWEDVDLCVRASTSGFWILYAPRAVIRHKGFGERKKDRLKGMPLYYATRGHLIFIGKHFTRRQLATAGLHFITGFPRAIWDYSRMTGQWTGALYMFRALFDAVRTTGAMRARR